MTAAPEHLLSTASLTSTLVYQLFERASSHLASIQSKGGAHHLHQLSSFAGCSVVTLFYEHSTRTRVSFELAATRLGMSSLHISAAESSVAKGESLQDTISTLAAMRPDILVLRHPDNGAVEEAAKVAGSMQLINAGDGTHEHPTQALLDAFTIYQQYGRIEDVKVAICGDLRHSRVARSNVVLLHMLGAKLSLVSPNALAPDFMLPDSVSLHTDLAEGIEGADIVMMLRIQKERMHDLRMPDNAAFFARYGLTRDVLARMAPTAKVMHPGPVNRGVEIAADLVGDSALSLIEKQVENGVAMRMAVLEWLKSGRIIA
jgi:aspartate carbamoyltransferase catalytic subunit